MLNSFAFIKTCAEGKMVENLDSDFLDREFNNIYAFRFLYYRLNIHNNYFSVNSVHAYEVLIWMKIDENYINKLLQIAICISSIIFMMGFVVFAGGSKPATLDTGAVVNVPLFINSGEEILVDTRTGTYIGRA